MGSAVWQAQVATAREIAARHKHVEPPSRSISHAREARTSRVQDAVGEYEAQCAKGMTDQQILWALEDFRVAGLDQPPADGKISKEQFVDFKYRQYRWYRTILVEGLHLTRGQLAQVDEKISEHLERGEQNFPVEGDSLSVRWPLAWRDNDPFAEEPVKVEINMPPWTLCGLTPDQASITWQEQVLKQNGQEPEATDAGAGAPRPERLKFLMPSLQVEDSDDQTVPDWLIQAGSVLRLLKNQQLKLARDVSDPFEKSVPNGEALFMEDVRRLHPAQLKTLLLMDATKAHLIQKILDQPVR